MTKFVFAESAWEDYLYWQENDKRMLKKINAFLREISRTPFEGTGKPEPLKNDPDGSWSRRINEKDRLIYYINDDSVMIKQCKGHYDDK
jgi:toxin YoeB